MTSDSGLVEVRVPDGTTVFLKHGPEFAVLRSAKALGAGRVRSADGCDPRTPPPSRVHHPDSKPKKRKAKQAEMVFNEGKDSPPRSSSTTDLDHQRGAPDVDTWRNCRRRNGR